MTGRDWQPKGASTSVEYQPINRSGGLSSGFDDEDDEDFIQREVRQHQMTMDKQDQDLDALHSSVKRLGDVSLQIGVELEEQNRMLDDMGGDLDRANQFMEVVTKKTEELIRQSGGARYFCIIVVLSVVLAILTYLVLFSEV